VKVGGKIAGRSLSALVVAAAVLAVPAGASAATTIGSNLANAPNANGVCGAACTMLELATTPNPATAPIDGVVVSWSTLGGSGTVGTFGNLRLRILRAAGGGAFTAVRSGPATSIPTSAGHPIVTTPVKPGLPINQNDYVGLDLLDGTSALATRTTSDTHFTYAFWNTPLADGAALPPDGSFTGMRELLYQVTIEPDCDKDGLGDETQDTNISCPQTVITAKKIKGTTAKFKFTSNEPGSTFQCKLDKRKFKPCSSPKKYKHLSDGKHKFKVRAVDKAGNVDASPAKKKFTI
jgi:hypothetical protein